MFSELSFFGAPKRWPCQQINPKRFSDPRLLGQASHKLLDISNGSHACWLVSNEGILRTTQLPHGHIFFSGRPPNYRCSLWFPFKPTAPTPQKHGAPTPTHVSAAATGSGRTRRARLRLRVLQQMRQLLGHKGGLRRAKARRRASERR